MLSRRGAFERILNDEEENGEFDRDVFLGEALYHCNPVFRPCSYPPGKRERGRENECLGRCLTNLSHHVVEFFLGEFLTQIQHDLAEGTDECKLREEEEERKNATCFNSFMVMKPELSRSNSWKASRNSAS